MAKTLQNFYKATITLDWTIGTGNFYVSTKPTTSDGWLVVSPNNTSTREIVAYNATGTDGNGDYITVSARGVGGTTEQTHTIGEPVRMNVTAEYWADMQNDIDDIVAVGVSNATTTSMGGVELATGAELIAGTDTSGAGHPLVAQPSIINARINSLVNGTLPTITSFTASGTYTKPAGLKYAIVEVQGAGGTGGTINAGGSCGGGGGGGYVRKMILAASIGTTETVTVGTAGIGSGNTSFGSLAVAGNGGNTTTATGGTAGAATGGDFNVPGQDGMPGNSGGPSSPGAGGNAFLGAGGSAGTYTPSNNNSGDGKSGYPFGGGGGASQAATDGSPTGTAGTGAPGVVIVTNYF